MNRSQYYEGLKERARRVRAAYGLVTPRVQRSDLRRIFRDCGVRIDFWHHRFKSLRGAYFDDEFGPTVMLDATLPAEPMIFTMAHELKHHLADRHRHLSYCDRSNENEPIEIGAEVFAAELIFPEGDFIGWMAQSGITFRQCTAETLVRLKHDTRTTMSYAGLAKRAEFLGYADRGSLPKVGWKKLEEQIFGLPLYKQIVHLRGRKHGVLSR